MKGIRLQMEKFSYYFGISLANLILRHTDGLAISMQFKGLTALEGQQLGNITKNTLKSLNSDEKFEEFWSQVRNEATDRYIDEPVLPKKPRPPPQRFMTDFVTDLANVSSNEPEFSDVKDYYKAIYNEALNKIVEFIGDRFNQPGFETLKNLECLLLFAASGKKYDEYLKYILNFYNRDFDEELLKSQLMSLSQVFSEKRDQELTFQDILQVFENMKEGMRQMFSQVLILIELVLIMPASNASSERFFSVLPRIKSRMRSTMGQARLNHLVICSIFKDELYEQNLMEILNEFSTANESRRNRYGTFVESDFL